MPCVAHLVRAASTGSLVVALAVLVLVPVSAEADTDQCVLVGDANYSLAGGSAVLTADRVADFDPPPGTSGTLRIELWALTAPYKGSSASGYKLAQYTVGTLAAGASTYNVNSGSVPYAPPPDGTWTFVMLLTEYSGAMADDGYSVRDWRNFSTPVVIGSPISPQPGNWDNPAESGTGYSIDFRHGVLVVVFFSFQPGGANQWYIASGPLSGDTFHGTLSKFVDGQCITCTYTFPTAAGDDGTVTIVFSSNTSATMYLPGGRVIPIQPLTF